ncbi:MAG: ubiquinol-cytochrome c reductase iron-sulfur subunit, partial [bacterium]
PPSGEARFGRIVILKSEVPAGKSKDIVVNNMPAFIINRPDKGLIALSKVCTHLGCLVEYDGEGRRIVCPCHAGIYDLEGNVLSGPPPKPLPRLLLRVEGENIVIG